MRGILIIEGSDERQQLLARQVRKTKVYSEIKTLEKFKEEFGDTPQGAIDKLKEKYCGLIFTNLDKVREEELKKQIPALFNSPDLPVLMLQNEAITGTAQDDITTFVKDSCKAEESWTVGSFVERQVQEIRAKVGKNKLLCGLSGGVDSSVAAALVAKAVEDQLVCVFVDHGLMRKNEGDEVEKLFANNPQVKFIRVDAEERFLSKLKGVTDPEQKRKIIGEEFIRVFEDEAKNFSDCKYLVQGTIYPDVLESQRGDKLIKSHHNVGGLPDVIDFEGIVEPLRDLFKDEVREVGTYLGLADEMVWRQPFPGPGLAVRCLGELTKEKLDILREADAIFREEIAKAGMHREINQYFAVLTNLRSVGIKDGKRAYDYVLALRAVKTKTFMTADWVRIPYDVLTTISERISAEVDGVGRIVYEITGKPPATIEWE